MTQVTRDITTLRMPLSLGSQIRALAKRNRRDLTTEIVIAIEQYIERETANRVAVRQEDTNG